MPDFFRGVRRVEVEGGRYLAIGRDKVTSLWDLS
jgi:hypothetical protein